jgi:UDP-galactopyranose mutase
MNAEYDYLIVGSGLFGAVCANELNKKGKKCLVIDKRSHKGGNVFCENINNINVHKYGPHIFHTNDKEIWEYVNEHAEFNKYIHSPLAIFEDEVYNLPFNMNTFYQFWKTKTPLEAQQRLAIETKKFQSIHPKNLEEQAISLIGKDIYDKLIKGYTEKQWGRDAVDLPAFIIKRIPVRFSFDNNYFNDKYQGIPIGGYNVIINSLLKKTEVKLGIDYFENRNYFDKIAKKIIFTGKIDQYYDYKFGELEYRSLKFEHETHEIFNYQGVSQINYTSIKTPYTRIIEHKHFEFGQQDSTIITKEYSLEWKSGIEPYYPINDNKNNLIFTKYKTLSQQESNVIFGGRLAEYKYYDMHQVIGSALSKMKKID